MIKLITNSEEFAYNTNTTTTDNTTSFGYGPGGVLFGTYHTGADGFITKRVSFHSPVLPTDIITIEYSANGTNWATIPTTFFAPTSQGNSRYGIAMSTVVGSNFCDVLFGAKGIHATGTTFGAVGENYITTHYWRVRKSSSAVAQPVSAIYNQPNSWTASNDFTTFKIKNSTFLTTIAGSATANRTITLPNDSGTVPLLESNNAWTASNDFTTFKIKNSTFLTTIAGSATANRTITLPNASGAVPLLESSNAWTALNKFTGVGVGSPVIQFLRDSVIHAQAGCSGVDTNLRISSQTSELILSCATNMRLVLNTGYHLYAPIVYSTIAGTANVSIASDGVLSRITSARKYKKNISLLEDTSFIHNIEPVRYQSKQGSDENMWYFGVVADQVDELGIEDAKMLVNYEILEDGTKQVEGFQYERLTVLLLAELQKLRREMDELKQQLGS